MQVYFNSKMIPSFGVAGNFTGHLEQAGEASDFINVKAAANAPKGIFPTYLPKCNITAGAAPDFLHTFPFDPKQIIYPVKEQKIQIEPECAIIFNAVWDKTTLVKLEPVCFGASNDCSIRKLGARKISEKKNWGPASKGFAENLIDLDGPFEYGCNIQYYRIASFLIRDGEVYSYGEDSEIRDYSYFYENLTNWMVDKFNNQKDEGPLENLYKYLEEAGFPPKIMVSIGATRYTKWGETNFLQEGDEAVVILYPGQKYSANYIKSIVADLDPATADKDLSILRQKIVF